MKIRKMLMFLPFHMILKPLIKRDYRLRRDGKRPDRMYWADSIASYFGYFVPIIYKLGESTTEDEFWPDELKR